MSIISILLLALFVWLAWKAAPREKQEDAHVHGAGRTDSGVHALGQVAHFDLVKEVAPDTVRDALNFHLKPNFITVVEAQVAAPAFHAPLSGVVTQGFGGTDFGLEPPITYNGVFYPHFHTGLDIAASMDTPVQAAAAGTVLLATSSVDLLGHLTGYGNYVVIDHGTGYLTLYGHLDKLGVTPGQSVQQGDVIGLLGSTGNSSGPHVHFEIRKDRVYVDPAPYLAAAIAG